MPTPNPSKFKAAQFVRDLLSRPTARDKQVVVGASNLSNPCARCLAEDMVATGEQQQGPYWLGAVIGTAVHNLLDARNEDPDCLPEQKVTLGTIPGYGVVRSTSDLFHIPSGKVVDYKTTTREKLGFIKRAIADEPYPLEVTKVAEARYKVGGYINQTMLYGLGMENAGYTVNRVGLVFICRDGLLDKDIWGWDTEYSRDRALAIWNRGVKLWAWLAEGHKPTELAGNSLCYRCSHRQED